MPPIDASTSIKWTRANDISVRNPHNPVTEFESIDEDFNPVPDLPKPQENPLDGFAPRGDMEGIVNRSTLARLFDATAPSGPVKFKGEDFVLTRPKHAGPAHHPERKEPVGHQEQDQHEQHVEARDPIDDGPAGDEHGDRPAEDGSGPTGPRTGQLRPAEDGSGPVGPRSSLSIGLRSTAVSYRAVASGILR